MVRDINSKLDKVISEQSDLRKFIDSRLTNLEKSINDKIVNECKNIRDEMYIEITKVNDNIKSVENHLKDFQDKMIYEVGELQTRVETVESQLQSTQKEPYDADITVVLTGLWYCETEKILEKAQSLVHDGLQETLPVVRAMHTPHRDGKPGIEFHSLDDKVRALRAKSKLSENYQYRRVFVRSSQTHTHRVLHQNTMTILKEMELDQKSRFTGSGRLSLKPATPHTNDIYHPPPPPNQTGPSFPPQGFPPLQTNLQMPVYSHAIYQSNQNFHQTYPAVAGNAPSFNSGNQQGMVSVPKHTSYPHHYPGAPHPGPHQTQMITPTNLASENQQSTIQLPTQPTPVSTA